MRSWACRTAARGSATRSAETRTSRRGWARRWLRACSPSAPRISSGKQSWPPRRAAAQGGARARRYSWSRRLPTTATHVSTHGDSVQVVAGTVYLVGAGPGDPGLMTRRSLELIATADAILYDRLIPPGALDGARGDAQLIYVGKQPGGHSMSQQDINARLVELGQTLRTVVRLKGGDPFVFGRGGEEAQALAEAGVPFEVVPGVTAGVAATAYAGIPVTHRDEASAVAFVTGHEDPEKPETALDWGALAAFPGTLVLYMGMKNLAGIAERLLAAGRAHDEPVAVVERGTLPGQRTVSGTLSDIAARVAEA